MIIIGMDLVGSYFSSRKGSKGMKAARAQLDAWRAIAEKANWRSPQDLKQSHPKASILKSGRVVFNIKGNDYRLVTLVRYQNGVLMIRFFGSHEEYDQIDAETV
jgi:mRNA interferase HigB